MSWERARINCARCYNIASKSEAVNNKGFIPREAHDSRNEAMEALESCFSEPGIDNNQIKNALVECLNCDYRSPKICDFYDRDVRLRNPKDPIPPGLNH